MGAFREPFQRSSTVGAAYLPRASLILGPLWGLGASASYGRGVRSIDPIYISQDLKTPFASAEAVEAGLTFSRRFGALQLGARSMFFDTRVDRDLIFSQTAGRNVLGGASTRIGSASSARLTGRFFDLAANLTYVHATFDDPDPTVPNGPAHPLIPYVPDLIFRFDGALFGEIPLRRLRPWGRPFRGTLSTGITYVGPRPLPYSERSNTIATVDLNATLGWWIFDLGFSSTNLFDARYRLGEYNYVSDFQHTAEPTLVPARHFSAGAPRALFFTLAVHLGGGQ
jgi:hypothetical protein